MRWTEEEYRRFLRHGPGVPLTEDAWQSAVIRLFKQHGYDHVYHTHDSRRSPSGWPDVAAIKPTGGTLYLCELKTDTGIVSQAQAAWLEALGGCTGVVADIWRPSMLSEVVERLRS